MELNTLQGLVFKTGCMPALNAFSLIQLFLFSCLFRLCVCDMDRLGRNEFIGEVRVALKKLKEGENKRYNMGLERIAQVCTVNACFPVF